MVTFISVSENLNGMACLNVDYIFTPTARVVTFMNPCTGFILESKFCPKIHHNMIGLLDDLHVFLIPS